jgi:glyoxylase-like metal-dependent hydrolase (beta-lactamase superfamily II)
VNAYLVGDVLVDTGIRASAKKIGEMLKGRTVKAIALTHAHGDHCGAARRLASDWGVPVWIGARDREAAESGKAVKKDPFNAPGISLVAGLLGDFPAVPIARELNEGDDLAAGFTVIDSPGHSPGHVSFWRERDRVLICADVFFNMNLFTTVPGLRQPLSPLSVDPALNRDSERKLAALEPRVAGFGHGPVIEGDAAERISAFVAKLPAR